MELRKLYTAFLNLVGGGELLDSVHRILFSTEKDALLSSYVDLVDGDLEEDNLQKIFQYYYSDRKEKCQDFTPKSIAKLCAVLTQTDGHVVYDLCAGSGALTIQKWAKNPEKTFVCEELDDRVIPILMFNLAVRNIGGFVVHRDALTLEATRFYRLTPGNRFSDIAIVDDLPVIMADEIISNPPYNIRWDAPTPLLADDRFWNRPIPTSSNANFAFVLTAINHMKPGGRCAFVLPLGSLSSDNEKEVREYLIDTGLVERVIVLPGGMFESTSIGTCVMVFSSGNSSVKFFDCRKMADQEQRDQNGQFGGASHENRTYHKTVNVLSDGLISRLCGGCDDVPGFSKEVPNEDIAQNGYNLTCSRYISFQECESEHRPFADIMADINRISRERSVIKITCNETFAKQIGLYDVAQLEDGKNDADLNKTFELLGGHYESRRYLTLTKSKEFKIENQDKEIWSSLINFILPMWKQHIFYLNQEENRLLVELRDAMLPELLSGKISIQE